MTQSTNNSVPAEETLEGMTKTQDKTITDSAGANDNTNNAGSNGHSSSKASALTEANVGSEVDRILNSINVNSFITQNNGSVSSETDKAPIETQQDTSAPTKANGTSSAIQDIPPCIIDFIAVTASGSIIAPSSEPILKGLLAFTQPAPGGCTVLTRGQSYLPHYAALLNAAYGHSLDFDDTHAVSSLHAGVTAIPTALAEAESQLRSSSTPPLSSSDILLAILLGYETTIRIGMALSTASYSRGFHNTSVAGIFGAVATISSLRKLSPDIITNAFGLAGSKAAGSMQYLANGSHNKRLHPGFAAHDAFLCVSLAEAGVVGADKIIEGDLGTLQAYTDRERREVDWNALVSGLSEKWEFEDSALKPYAGCRMTHAFIELADDLGKGLREDRWREKGVKQVKRIRCSMPKANMILVGQRTANKVHPENIVDAQFSCYYQVANAVVYGGTHDMKAYDRLQDSAVREMCEKVDCVVDEGMKGMSGRMDVFLEDAEGEVVEIVRKEITEPLGERSHPFVREKVEEKFMGLMSPVYGEERSRKVMELVDSIGSEKDDGGLLKLMDLLAKTESAR